MSITPSSPFNANPSPRDGQWRRAAPSPQNVAEGNTLRLPTTKQVLQSPYTWGISGICAIVMAGLALIHHSRLPVRLETLSRRLTGQEITPREEERLFQQFSELFGRYFKAEARNPYALKKPGRELKTVLSDYLQEPEKLRVFFEQLATGSALDKTAMTNFSRLNLETRTVVHYAGDALFEHLERLDNGADRSRYHTALNTAAELLLYKEPDESLANMMNEAAMLVKHWPRVLDAENPSQWPTLARAALGLRGNSVLSSRMKTTMAALRNDLKQPPKPDADTALRDLSHFGNALLAQEVFLVDANAPQQVSAALKHYQQLLEWFSEIGLQDKRLKKLHKSPNAAPFDASFIAPLQEKLDAYKAALNKA